MRRITRVLTRIDVSSRKAPAVRIDPGVAITKLQQQPTNPVYQDHPSDPGIHPRIHKQAA
jgi:hypothetical protein